MNLLVSTGGKAEVILWISIQSRHKNPEKIPTAARYTAPAVRPSVGTVFIDCIFTLRVELYNTLRKENTKEKQKQGMGVRHPSYDYTSARKVSAEGPTGLTVQYQLLVICCCWQSSVTFLK
jgi:hypothetical protein